MCYDGVCDAPSTEPRFLASRRRYPNPRRGRITLDPNNAAQATGLLALAGVFVTGATQVVTAFVQRPKEKKLAETSAEQRHLELVKYVNQELAAASQKFSALKQEQSSLPTIPDIDELEKKLNDVINRVQSLEKDYEHDRVDREQNRKANMEIQLDLREVLTTIKFMQGQPHEPKGRPR